MERSWATRLTDGTGQRIRKIDTERTIRAGGSMKRFIILGASICLFSGAAHAAGAARHGETAPVIAEAERHVAATLPDPHGVTFRNVAVHPMDATSVVCGEMAPHNPPAGGVFMKFGYVQGQDDPVIFSGREVPQKVEFNEVNSWLNDSIKLEDLEEMGCVPRGTYHSYNERLNRVMSQRKQFGVN
ncbi:hypothetical protein CFR80_09880 [Komagataeibacter oboediens]|uniref:Uncharacterized protein n=2 Tax=Komagataeibacter TaxID=1434011 RepID=A0A318R6H4_9PROT|nr:hypothetical protein CFR80_09880 [Komagataeibacter oboediens]